MNNLWKSNKKTLSNNLIRATPTKITYATPCQHYAVNCYCEEQQPKGLIMENDPEQPLGWSAHSDSVEPNSRCWDAEVQLFKCKTFGGISCQVVCYMSSSQTTEILSFLWRIDTDVCPLLITVLFHGFSMYMRAKIWSLLYFNQVSDLSYA